MRPVKTDLKFTQTEVRQVLCLLTRNEVKPSRLEHIPDTEWAKVNVGLRRKFQSIDTRWPKVSA